MRTPLFLLLPSTLALLAGVAQATSAADTTAPPTLHGQSFLTLPGEQYALLWHDEFDGDRLDPAKWSIGLPWKGDDGTNRHHNSQYASVIADEDVHVKDGALHLTTRRVEVPNPKGGTYHYTEGLITTSGKFETRYGYLEIRALLPTNAGPGTWPAFWTLTKGWPPEMDILEYWGSQNRIHQGTVTRAPNGSQHWDSFHRANVSLAGWHTYGMEWGPGYQIYNIDGTATNVIYGAHIPEMPHYILLNSGVESARPPRPGTSFPNDLVVDYVRVYARPENAPALLDGGFEADDLSPWERVAGEASAGDFGAHSGKRCLRVDAAGDGETAAGSIRQTVHGLKPGTRYVLTAYARASGSGTAARLGFSTDAADKTPALSDPLTKTEYAPLSLSFTTGQNATSVVISCLVTGPGAAFFDDVRLAPAP